jgi:hypothetical protein
VVRIVSASYGCGPADGPWVEATVLSSVTERVVAQIWFDGAPYGQSDPVALQAGGQATIGLDPATPREAFGNAAVVRIATSRDPASPLAAEEVVLRLPAGVSCG